MPELPEVETLRIGLEKVLVSNVISDVEIKNKKIISGNGTKRIPNKEKELEFITGITNKKIISVTRRAKNIIITLADNSIILVHLKMTGQMIYDEEPHKHTHIIFKLKKGMLNYNDVRQFGYVLWYESEASAVGAGHFQKLGLEPFDKKFTLKYFAENIIKKNKSIKAALLEQTVVVGCGNIYCDEICFASSVLPTKNCKTLSDLEIKDIHKNIIKILSKAIEMGGSSISDYVAVNGESGKYGNVHKVYGRSGLTCYTCKNILEKTVISGRATVFCNTCQK